MQGAFKADSKPTIGPIRRVEIKREPGAGLGLKILTDEECRVARVSEIIAGRPAALCGGINIGDRLISANGTVPFSPWQPIPP
jgi:hypothetical protein